MKIQQSLRGYLSTFYFFPIQQYECKAVCQKVHKISSNTQKGGWKSRFCDKSLQQLSSSSIFPHLFYAQRFQPLIWTWKCHFSSGRDGGPRFAACLFCNKHLIMQHCSDVTPSFFRYCPSPWTQKFEHWPFSTTASRRLAPPPSSSTPSWSTSTYPTTSSWGYRTKLSRHKGA